jgi:hypothetical protein
MDEGEGKKRGVDPFARRVFVDRKGFLTVGDTARKPRGRV